MKVCYVPKQFRGEAGQLVIDANIIIERYQAEGFRLTLRQLYYQFVARDLFPDTRRYVWLEDERRWQRSTAPNATKNAEPNYKWLGATINDARLAGLVDWEAIEDRTRNLKSLPHWNEVTDIVNACAAQFRTDLWDSQPFRVEVWIEKEALAGVIERPCVERDVPFFCCRGYTSASEVWGAAQRFIGYNDRGQDVLILHFGDHDPSGMDMSRDIEERLRLFGAEVEFRRVALNFEQVQRYKPPPNPAKETDSRFAAYRKEYGEHSWELDALEPSVLANLVHDHLDEVVDVDRWQAAQQRQDTERARLVRVAKRWGEVVKFIERTP